MPQRGAARRPGARGRQPGILRSLRDKGEHNFTLFYYTDPIMRLDRPSQESIAPINRVREDGSNRDSAGRDHRRMRHRTGREDSKDQNGLTRQRASAAAAPASAGDGRRPTQREQAPQRRRSRKVSRTSATGARSAGARACASTSAKGTNARSAGGRVSASTIVRGATARIA